MVCCSAINCSNRSDKNTKDVGFHAFPNDPVLRKRWVVLLKREGFVPSKHSRVCSAHFLPDCFDVAVSLGKEFGIPRKKTLKPDACPTLFNFGEKTLRKPDKFRGAYEKRRRSEVLEECLEEIPKKSRVCDSAVGDEGINEDSTMEPHTDIFNAFCQTPRVMCKDFQTQFSPQQQDKTFQIDVCISKKDASFQYEPALSKRDFGIQCSLLTDSEHQLEVEDEQTEMVENIPESDDDPLWLPDNEESDLDDYDYDYEEPSEEGTELREDKSPIEEGKFIVFESCLVKLFKFCIVCFLPCTVILKNVMGSMIVVQAVCKHGHKRLWNSQPVHKKMPIGNLLLAASSLANGCNPVRTVNLLKHINIKVFALRTYHWLQAAYLCPAVDDVWLSEKRMLAESRKGKKLKLGGDARCCSPGHTAKYGSYSFMDLETATILEMQLIQSSEVKNSGAMELEGLRRCFSEIKDNQKLDVGELTTDRHVQVKKFMKEEKKEVQHWFDVWHVAKGVKKKLEKRGKKKDLGDVGLWAKSVSNHLYWCAASSDGNGGLVVEKWKSILNHVCNIHEGHSLEFPNCLHGPLTDRHWLQKGSRVYKNLEDIICSKPLLKDIPKLAPKEQTSALESFHKIVCFFAPKHGHFFYDAMRSRLHMACLHFNENSAREQAVTQTGEKQWRVSYKKANSGQPVATQIKVAVSYAYVQKVLEAVYERRLTFPSYRVAYLEKKDRTLPPPSVTSKYEKSEKSTIVSQRMTRFNTD